MQQLELPLLPPRDQLYRALYGGSVDASAQNMVDRHSDHHGRPPLDPPQSNRRRSAAAFSLNEVARRWFSEDFSALERRISQQMREAVIYGHPRYDMYVTRRPEPGPIRAYRPEDRIPDDTFEWSREMVHYCVSDAEMTRRAFLHGLRPDYIIADDLAFP